jgi:phage terminase large subunit
MNVEALQQPQWEFPDDLDVLFDPQYRYIVLKGGRGGTKSWSAARACLIRGYEKPMRILCAREVQRSIKDSVHQLLADQISLLGLEGFYEILQNEIRGKNGTKIIFTGLSNLTADSIKSLEGVDLCWCEESHTLSRKSLDILLPTVRKEGSQFYFTFNPELDTDEVWIRFVENTPESCAVRDCSYYNNPWFPTVLEDERQNFLRQVEQGKRRQADYEWIWEGKCKPAVEGAIFPDEVARTIEDGRLCNVPYDPTCKTYTVWDLGYNDSMVVLFVQVKANAVHIIDVIEDSHRTYDSYVQEIKERPYTIEKCWLPHDGKHKNAQTGKSPVDLLNALGLPTDRDGVPDIGVKQGIEAARQMFPRCYFDKDRCTDLFNHLRRYARVISPTTGEAGAPKKDGHDHAADAFRYLAVIEKQLTNETYNLEPLNHIPQGIV